MSDRTASSSSRSNVSVTGTVQQGSLDFVKFSSRTVIVPGQNFCVNWTMLDSKAGKSPRFRDKYGIVEKLDRDGPLPKRELARWLIVEKRLPKATAYDQIMKSQDAGVLERLPDDGRLAPLNYSKLDEEIERVIVQYREVHSQEPSIDKIALRVGRPPEDPEFRKALFHAAKKVRWNRTWCIIKQVFPPEGRENDPPRVTLGELRRHSELMRDSLLFKSLSPDAVLIAGATAQPLKTSLSPEEMKKEWREWAEEEWNRALKKDEQQMRGGQGQESAFGKRPNRSI